MRLIIVAFVTCVSFVPVGCGSLIEWLTTEPSEIGALGLRCSVASNYLVTQFQLPAERGCVVLRVSGAAERSGIRQGDLMVKMDEIQITSGRQFTKLFEEDGLFKESFTVLRAGSHEPLEFTVELDAPARLPGESPDPFYYYLRARGYRGESPQDAIRDYTRAIELAPEFDLAYLYRAGLYERVGNLEAARSDFERAIEMSPRLGEAHRWYAQFLMWQGQAEEALLQARQASRFDECSDGSSAFEVHNVDCSDDFALLSWIYDETGEGDPLSHADRAVDYYPLNEWALHNAACLHAAYISSEPEADARAEQYAEQYLALPPTKAHDADAHWRDDMLSVVDGGGCS